MENVEEVDTADLKLHLFLQYYWLLVGRLFWYFWCCRLFFVFEESHRHRIQHQQEEERVRVLNDTLHLSFLWLVELFKISQLLIRYVNK